MATYRGHISKKLTGLFIEGDRMPIVGSKIFKEVKEIGQVTSTTRSPSLGCNIALAYIKYGHFDSGNQVQVQDADGMISVSIAELPFYKKLAG